MSGTTATRSTRPRPRIRYCQEHASAPFRPFVPADPHEDWGFCTSIPVHYDRSATPASDGSIHRYYDPTTGQFISSDPLVDVTGQPYAYVGDDPVNNVDPSGLFCWGLCSISNAWNDTGGKAVSAGLVTLSWVPDRS